MTLMGLMLPALVIGMGFTALLVNRDIARAVADALGSVEARWVALFGLPRPPAPTGTIDLP